MGRPAAAVGPTASSARSPPGPYPAWVWLPWGRLRRRAEQLVGFVAAVTVDRIGRAGCAVAAHGGVREGALMVEARQVDGGAGGLTTVVLEVSGVQCATEKARAESVLRRRPGVVAVEANPVAQTATVVFDPAGTSVAELAGWVRDCGFHCRGQSVPEHVCDPLAEPAGAAAEPAGAADRAGVAGGHVEHVARA